MSIVDMTVAQLARAIRKQELSPVEIMDAYLARIEQWEPKLNAFTEVYVEEAQLAAEASHKAIRANYVLSPLHGIPIVLKDLVEINGKMVTAGSTAWTRRSSISASIVKRLISRGLVILGKTNLVQFAVGGWGTNADMGTPWNPWSSDMPLTPGGSSSGSAVAVAGGLAPCALGTDTGGSVRIPAAWCGLTGLKVTQSVIDRRGVVPVSRSLDTVGPITRTVEDAALLLDALGDANDKYENSVSPPPSSLKGLKLGLVGTEERSHANAEVLAAYDGAVQVFEDLGAHCTELKLPWPLSRCAAVSGTIMCTEAYAQFSQLVDDERQELDPHSRAFVAKGRGVSAVDYLRALAQRVQFKEDYYSAVTGFDAVLLPTTPTPPIPISIVDHTTTMSHFTRPANILDLCAISVPCGLSASGLPISMQIVGLPGTERRVLGIAASFQGVTDWHLHRPGGLGLNEGHP